jgi:nitrate/nitrite transporter NarK
MSVGGAAGAALTGLLLQHWSWRLIFFCYALPGVVWSAFFYRWFRERPEEHASVNSRELALIREAQPVPSATTTTDVEPTPWKAILRSPTMWWINAQHFFRGAGYIFYATWFATFLKETRGVSVKDSGLLTSLPLLAVVFGSPLGGMLSDRVLRRTGSLVWARQGVAISSMLGCAVLIVLSYFVENAWLAVLVISAGSLCAAIGGPCSYAITIDVGGKHVAPVFSMMNMWGNFGSLAFPIVVPRLVRWTGSWNAALFLFAAIYVAAAVSWIGANPRKPVIE